MALLALDLGTRTGFALMSNGSITSGVQNFTPTRYDSSAMRFVRFKRFLDEVNGGDDPLHHVVFEEVRRHKGVSAAHAYGGFLSHLLVWCEEKGVACEPFAVGEIKKFWTGKGNAPKEAMIAAAKAQGYAPADDNEADALAMLHLAIGRSIL